MQRLHSNSTIYLKFIFPLVSFILIIYLFIVSLKKESWVFIVIIIMIGVILFGIIKTFYSKLKYVYLDEVKGQVLIRKNKKYIVILLDEIKDIDKIKILNVLLIIKVNQIEFGDDFIFVPKNSFFIGNTTEKKLKNLIHK